MMCFSVKERKEKGKWEQVDPDSLAGKTLREVLSLFVDREAVAELSFGKRRCYFAGTDYWRERMQRSGPALRFADAVKCLEKVNPWLLEETLPSGEAVLAVFSSESVEIGRSTKNDRDASQFQ